MKKTIICLHQLLAKQRYWLTLLLVWLWAQQALYAQVSQDTFWNEALERIAKPNSKPGWIYFKDSTFIDAATVFQVYKTAFRLKAADSLGLKKFKEDNLGYVHLYFDQYYNNIRIEGGEMIVHAKSEFSGEFSTPIAKTANGKLVIGLNLNTTPLVNSQEALNKVFDVFTSEFIEWTRDTSLFPRGKLVIQRIDLNKGFVPENMTLAWRFDLIASFESERFYVDAKTGAILNSIPIAINCDPATVTTTWYGNKVISVRQPAPGNFILQDDCAIDHAWQLHTFDGNDDANFIGGSTEFNSTDAAYNATFIERIGGTTHWGLHESLDYYETTFGRNGWNGLGANLNAYARAGYGNNAFWHGAGVMSFGNGASVSTDNDDINPLDVAGHELTHGVIESEANLIYSYESGALNESFADIFGEAIERSALGANNWLMGADIAGFGPIRSFINPNNFSHPDTYKGTNWWTSPGDAGGVHTNSSVQNRWFYLLANGGSGTNDFSETFSVSGIGFDKAAAIAYRNLTVYLTNGSQFLDAREGALNAAADLFGNCSDEQIQVGRAWYAVHVGNDHPDFNNQICGVISSGDYWGINSVLGGGTCNNDVIPTAGNINYAASREVTLLPGCTVTASAGNSFSAYVEPCAITIRNAFSQELPAKHGDFTFADVNQHPVESNASSIKMAIRPNPIQANATLAYKLESPTVLTIVLQDNVGRILRTIQQKQVVDAGTYTLDVDANDLPAGLFFISITTDTAIITQKMIVVK